jgi:hypothetical protein
MPKNNMASRAIKPYGSLNIPTHFYIKGLIRINFFSIIHLD